MKGVGHGECTGYLNYICWIFLIKRLFFYSKSTKAIDPKFCKQQCLTLVFNHDFFYDERVYSFFPTQKRVLEGFRRKLGYSGYIYILQAYVVFTYFMVLANSINTYISSNSSQDWHSLDRHHVHIIRWTQALPFHCL